MAKNLKPGDEVHGYEIVEHISTGMLAISYKAQTRKEKETVFFKQYKSPSCAVSWYKDYIKYQDELKSRIESTRAKDFTYKFIDFFEAKAGPQTYFQVFEFISEGEDLGQVLERLEKRPGSVSWDQRLIFAKVMMAGISSLHSAGIVHCDLKPPNIHLIRDSSITAGYRLKLIDLDYSVLSDKKAPWHGHQEYVGSPRYFSPEHLKKGETPSTASDVFTSGLMLYQLLAQGHPYYTEDDEDYQKAVFQGKPPVPVLAGDMPAPANNEAVSQILQKCLSPKPKDRPTAQEVNLILNGRAASSVPPKAPPEPPRKEADVAERKPEPFHPPKTPDRDKGSTGNHVQLVGSDGVSLQMSIRTEVGRALLKQFGSDSQFASAHQFTLERMADSSWIVRPNSDSTNATLLNGKTLRNGMPLKDGDIISVGREEKGVSKLPLTVRIR